MKSKIFIIAFLITNTLLFSQRDVRIISSDFKSLTIEYLPVYTDTSEQVFNGNVYKNIDLYLGRTINIDSWGSPSVTERSIEVGVPSEFGNTIEILSSSYKELNGKIRPIPYPAKDSLSFSFEFNESPEYYIYQADEELIAFGEFGLVRDVGAQTINLKPIKFYPTENKIRLYTRIVFKISFANTGNISSKPADDLIDGLLVNYDVAKYWNNSIVNKSLNKTDVVSSVLASGRWFRFEAPDEGIYKISKSELAAYGIDANTVDPRTIKIYNNGGKALPENNSAARPIDLEENAILVIGQDDGKFDDADYILFYGRGTKFWDYAIDGVTIQRFNNPYSSKNYYWITSGGSNGKRMSEKQSLSATPTYTQTTTEAFADWDEDKINLGKSGRQWMGDNFSTSVSSRTYTNTLSGRVSGTPINYNVRFINGSTSTVTFRLNENGNLIHQQNLAGHDNYYKVGREHSINASYNNDLVDDRSVLNISVSLPSSSVSCYLDYFQIKYTKELKAFSNYLLFFSNSVGGTIEYQTNSFSTSNIKAFDVTDFNDVKIITNSYVSGSECKFTFDEQTSRRSKYLLVENSVFKSPRNRSEVTNSNIRGEEIGAKYIIVTHKNFMEAANTLKHHKETNSPVTISTYIADIDQIYNEFSGGSVDPSAVRDYLKYAFDNWQIKPEYVLLFGKGTYDYKNIEGFGDNFVPTWQSDESLELIYSYTTDDYFGRISATDLKVDIALGRITNATLSEANHFVNKIIDYELNQDNGDWRNLITLISDDGCKSLNCNEGNLHTAPSENLTNNFPGSFNFNKIYCAAYPDEYTSQGRRKPTANIAILNAINNGSLFVNYFGHGSPEVWADERIFEKSTSIPQIKNSKYFFLGAATCDFGYFDIPNYQSAAEALIYMQNAGAIAGFSSTRLVYAFDNEQLMKNFITKLFNSPRDSTQFGIPIGKAAMDAKTTSINDQKYVILGDPTLRLLVPRFKANIDSINGQNFITDVQLKALSSTKVDGSVLNTDGTLWNDFNGEGTLTIYDSQRKVRLEAINYDVNMPGGVIFNGRVSITNGKFSVEFVVPKDISYENKNGKVVLYFTNNEVDGIGYTNKILVGGTDSTAQNDGVGPEIDIYFDDITNVNGTLVNKDSKLIVDIADETGINTTGTGVGHKLEGILNQQIQNPIDFTNYFTGDLDAGGKSGKIEYQFSSLENGNNHLKVKAWDVFNNPSENEVYFTVVDGSNLEIQDVYNYPNPFKDKTQFTFQQNLTKPIDVKIKIYTIAGRLIHEIEKHSITDKFVVFDWDGKDIDGDKISNGTYLYKIIVKSVDGEFNKSVLGKMAVLN